MSTRSSGPTFAPAATSDSSPSCRFAAQDWGELREAGLLRSGGHEPLILAFVSGLTVGGDEADVERIRAEVRGLGVTMMLISPDAVWSFGADDSLRKVRAPADVDAAALRDLSERLGMLVGADAVWVGGGRDQGEGSVLRAVFVVDPDFVLRFAHIEAQRRDVGGGPTRSTLDVLLRALVAASAAFERRRAPGVRLSFSELTTLSVVSGMQRVLLGQEAREVAGAAREVAGAAWVPAPPAAQASLVLGSRIPPLMAYSQLTAVGRHAPEPGRHAVRTSDAPVSSAHGASS